MIDKTLVMPTREVIPGLAAKLREAREAAKLSQVDAGKKSRVHHVSIARYETEERVPTLSVLYKLAAAYGVKATDLLPDAQPKNSKKPGKD